MSDDELLHGPLEAQHREHGATFAPFGVADAGGLRRHRRRAHGDPDAVGLFDVSHLGKALVTGPGAAEFVNSALTNDLRRIGPGKAQYTCAARPAGA